jgi:hypothetical protein
MAVMDFLGNFVANLSGAMFGVLLAFWIDRLRVRRDDRALYGRVLQTSHSELAFVKPMCEHVRDASRADKGVGTFDFFALPATSALLVSPLVHNQAPYSLLMAATILCRYFEANESIFRVVSQKMLQLSPSDAATREILSKKFGDQMDNANNLITIALEQIDSQLKLLGLEKKKDVATQEVSRRLLEVLRK